MFSILPLPLQFKSSFLLIFTLFILSGCIGLLPVGGAILSSGGDDDGGGGSSGGSGGGSSTPTPPSPSVVYLWASTTTTDGDINFNGMSGVAGADEICDNDSSGQTFVTTVSVHRAVIASSSFNPRNIFANNPPVDRPDGLDIITTYSGFFTATSISINISAGTGREFWTGLNASGNPHSSALCNDWQSNSSSDNGRYGNTFNRFVSRISRGSHTCDNVESILCISY